MYLPFTPAPLCLMYSGTALVHWSSGPPLPLLSCALCPYCIKNRAPERLQGKAPGGPTGTRQQGTSPTLLRLTATSATHRSRPLH